MTRFDWFMTLTIGSVYLCIFAFGLWMSVGGAK